MEMSRDFYLLDPPFRTAEKHALRARSGLGPMEELHLWNGKLLCEYGKMKLCIEENIPVKIVNHEFSSPRQARIWAIRYSLEHRTCFDPWRYWLIGQLYFEMREEEQDPTHQDIQRNELSATSLLREFQITRSTLDNYRFYAQGIRRFFGENEDTAFRILRGEIALSLNNMRQIMKLSPEDFSEVAREMEEAGEFVSPNRVTAILEKRLPPSRPRKEGKRTTIKDMPAYDPDAEVMSLLLTLPIWTRQMERAQKATDFCKVTPGTVRKLGEALTIHRMEVQQLLRLLRKAQYGLK